MDDYAEFRTIRGYELERRGERSPTHAMEDYLEMIGRLGEKTGAVRAVELSEHLHVRPSSTSKMMGKLRDMGYVEASSAGDIRLTADGRTLAQYLIRRHRTVEAFLRLLGHAEPLVETELLEHNVSAATVWKLERLAAFFEERPEVYQALRDDLDKK